jgi:hypothetical protein
MAGSTHPPSSQRGWRNNAIAPYDYGRVWTSIIRPMAAEVKAAALTRAMTVSIVRGMLIPPEG